MPFSRNIGPVQFLDTIASGDVVHESLTAPANTAGVTGWKEIRESTEYIQHAGIPVISMMGRNPEGFKLPVVGYQGDEFTEVASLTNSSAPFELKPDLPQFMLLYKFRLMTDGALNFGTVTVQLRRGIISQTLLSVPYGAIGSTLDQTEMTTGTLNSTLLPTSGQTDQCSMVVTYDKSSPAAQTSMGPTHWEGLLYAQLYQYK